MKKIAMLLLAMFCFSALAMADVPAKPGAQVTTKKKIVVTKVKRIKRIVKKGATPAVPATPAAPAVPPKK